MTDDKKKKSKLTSPHDNMFHVFITHPSVYLPFFRRYLPREIQDDIDWETLHCTDQRYVAEDLRNLYSDCVFEARRLSSDEPCFFYLLLEHKDQVEVDTPFQVNGYMHQIWRDYRRCHPKGKLPYIHPMVFYTGAGSYYKSLHIKDLIDGPEALVGRLWNEPIQLISSGSLGQEGEALLLNLMSLVFMRDAKDYIRSVLRGLTALAKQERKTFIESVFRYILETVDITGASLAEAVEQEIGKEEAAMAMTGAERLRKEGRQEGRQEGRLEGRREGRQEGEIKGKLSYLNDLVRRGLLSKELYESEAKPLEKQLETFKRQYGH